MILSAIVAVSDNLAIGVDNDLPWHMPADLKYFKDTTRGYHVLMGRKSFDSIGRPLPGRTNIILTRQKDFYHSGVTTVHNISDGINYAREKGVDKLFVLGGANVYNQTKELWDELHITRIKTQVNNATAFFPELDYSKWSLESEDTYKADEKNPHDYTFCKYVRP